MPSERFITLLDVRRAQPISKVEPGSIDHAGVSAIWCRLEGLADLADISGVLIPPVVFIGGAGGMRAGRSSGHRLDARIRQHVDGSIGSSTLRRSVAALLLSRERRTGRRPGLPELEGLAGDWVHQHLLATWLAAPTEEVNDLVRGAVAAFDPQMNLPQVDTPFRQFLSTARGELDRWEGER